MPYPALTEVVPFLNGSQAIPIRGAKLLRVGATALPKGETVAPGTACLAVDDDAVQRVAGAGHAYTVCQNLEGLAGIEMRRIKACQPAITVPGLAIARETHSVVQRNVGPDSATRPERMPQCCWISNQPSGQTGFG